MRNTILIVDDVDMNRGMLTEILEEEYPIATAENGKQALETLRERFDEIAVVLLDLVMPEMDGFAVLEVMKQKTWLEKIPVLVITGEGSVEVEEKCFSCGVSDFIRKPFDNTLVKKRVKNIADLFLYKNRLEEKVEEQTKTLKEQYDLLHIQAEKLKASKEQMIDVLGNVVECRNLESGEHIQRVKGFTRIMAERAMKDYPEYGLDRDMVETIVSASALHDVGKIAIPDNILLKPGRLTDEEFAFMKTHTTRGSEILNDIKGVWDDEYSEISYDICRYHHERYDGKGYPDGLAGEEIPISAQLVSVADVYDALVSDRIYKKAFSKEEAFEMIINGKCGTFSPKMMECFRNSRKEFEELAAKQHK